jgi:hypothetical protein
MDDSMETREYELERAAVANILRELASRVRLKAELKKQPWWRFWAGPVMVVSGPRFALDAVEPVIQKLDFDAWETRQS